MTTFTDKVAVVTGASSGIGRAIALGLAAQGAIVCLVGRTLDALKAVADEVHLTGSRAPIYQCDLSRDEDIHALCNRLEADCGHVDILIHSAGVIDLGPIATAPVKGFDWQYAINVRAPYLLTQTMLPLLRPARGQIVFMNSTAGRIAGPNVGQYAATKHALKALADSLRGEVNADGIRVMSVFVGRTATPMQAAVRSMEAKPYNPEQLMQPDDVSAVVINALALPTSAEVTDISIRPLTKCS